MKLDEMNPVSSRFCLSALLIISLGVMAGCASPPATARVIQVIDGDTIIVEGGYRVRYIGIDAPELYPEAELYGTEAWQENRRLVEGEEIRLEKDVSETDEYGRLLRYVYVGEVLVNAELVRQGLARAEAYPPDTEYQDYLEAMEAEAKSAGRGMWAK